MPIPVDVSLLAPAVKNATTLTAAAAAGIGAARVAMLTEHPPALVRVDQEVGLLCGTCSPGESRVAWPCPEFLTAADGVVSGLLR